MPVTCCYIAYIQLNLTLTNDMVSCDSAEVNSKLQIRKDTKNDSLCDKQGQRMELLFTTQFKTESLLISYLK